MPEMNGWELVKIYSDHFYSKAIIAAPIYLFSSTIRDEYYDIMNDYPCIKGCYPKPLDPNKIYELRTRK